MLDGANRILLTHRADDGSWGLPGGGVEPGESWSQAAVRECQEETGWLVRIIGLFGVYSDPNTQEHVYPDGRCVHFLGVVLRAELTERVGEPREESIEADFFQLDELPMPFFEPDRAVIEDLSSTARGPFIR